MAFEEARSAPAIEFNGETLPLTVVIATPMLREEARSNLGAAGPPRQQGRSRRLMTGVLGKGPASGAPMVCGGVDLKGLKLIIISTANF